MQNIEQIEKYQAHSNTETKYWYYWPKILHRNMQKTTKFITAAKMTLNIIVDNIVWQSKRLGLCCLSLFSL